MRRRGSCGSSTEAEPPPRPPHRGSPRRPRRLRALCASCGLALLAVSLLGCLGLVASAALHGRALTPTGVFAPVNFFFMRLARDLSRVKARRRRFGQENALIAVLTAREEPLPLADAAEVGIALTAEELAEFDGRFLPDSTERSPLYLGIKGRIYDVSAAWSFYGPGKSYYGLVRGSPADQRPGTAGALRPLARPCGTAVTAARVLPHAGGARCDARLLHGLPRRGWASGWLRPVHAV